MPPQTPTNTVDPKSLWRQERRANHVKRMTTRRVIDGIECWPGQDVCGRRGCQNVFQPKSARERFCSPECRGIEDDAHRAEKRRIRRATGKIQREAARDARIIKSRRALGLLGDVNHFGEPCMAGLARDEGLGGIIPWEHSWAGTDPLPA